MSEIAEGYNHVEARLEQLSRVLDIDQMESVRRSISSVLDRLLLGRLATDEAFRVIRDLPDVYTGESAVRIDARLSELGLGQSARETLVPKLKTMLLRGKGHDASTAQVTDGALRGLFSRLSRSGRQLLRCNCCGYHFRRCDLSASRWRLVERSGLELSKEMSDARRSDPIKTAGLTALEVDHKIPRAGWGPTDVSNLQALCRLCNQGKMIFENGGEAVSVLAAAGYSLNHTAFYAPNMTIFYSCIVMAERKCANCGVTSRDAELTVKPDGEWFTPWTSKVLCYECHPCNQ
jgi:hypothetical protein